MFFSLQNHPANMLSILSLFFSPRYTWLPHQDSFATTHFLFSIDVEAPVSASMLTASPTQDGWEGLKCITGFLATCGPYVLFQSTDTKRSKQPSWRSVNSFNTEKVWKPLKPKLQKEKLALLKGPYLDHCLRISCGVLVHFKQVTH